MRTPAIDVPVTFSVGFPDAGIDLAPRTRPAIRPIKYVYIAGPITKGDQFANVRAALDVNKTLMDAGLAPFCPHLSCFAEVTHPTPFEEWLAFDFAWIERCDALLRLPGESVGADREVEHARRLGLHVYEVDEVATVEVFLELVKLNNLGSVTK